jgi:Lamin Tail Domain/Secretion system C-terminal sorting domain
MKKITISFFSLFIFLFFSNKAFSQLSILQGSHDYIIDFDNTVSGVNNGVYQGSGFAAAPVSGQLNANAWSVTGMSDGDLNFGVEASSGDFAKGTSPGGVGNGGLYAFDIGGGDIAFGVQPGTHDWTPGSIILKILNNTGYNITSLDISYDIYVYNDQGKSNSFNFSYSTDNSVYTDVTALNYSSAEAADASPSWQKTNKSTTISSLSITSGNYFYIKWMGDYAEGSGSMDEFGLDNITINASTGTSSQTLVTFSSASAIVDEGDGTYSLNIQIENPSSSGSTSADVVLINGDNSDIDNYSTQTVTFPSNSSSDQSVLISITDDISQEGDETLMFELQNISGGNSADIGAQSTFELTIEDNDIPKIVINEILADPDEDTNGDNVLDTKDDEFIEFVNNNGSDVDISGWQIFDQVNSNHTFQEGTIVPDGESIVVFGGGNPSGIPGLVQVSSDGDLSLNNSNETIALKDKNGIIVASYSYTSTSKGKSLARNPDITGDFVKHSDITSNPVNFSPGRRNSDNSPLPVELVSFSCNLQGNLVNLYWQTVTEINNNGFDIQRSMNNKIDWKSIGFVNGHDNSNSPKDYSFNDKNISRFGKYYYRLKQIDNDGKATYSKTISVEYNLKSNKLMQNYPNPFNPVTTIGYIISSPGKVNLSVFDILGEEVAVLVDEYEKPGSYEVEFSTDENGNNLHSGVYFYTIRENNFTKTRKMLILK